MKNDPEAFLKERFLNFEIQDVVDDWLLSLEATDGISQHTIRNYRYAMHSLRKSMQLNGTPETLEYLTETAVNQWRKDMSTGAVMRQGKPASPPSIIAYTIACKVFANKYLRKRYTHHDILELVECGEAEVPPKPGLTSDERKAILDALEGSSFTAVRDRAFIQMVAATACRFSEIAHLPIGRVDPVAGSIQVRLKGGRYADVALQKAALRDLKVYLSMRRAIAQPGVDDLWVSDEGGRLTEYGLRAIFNRLEARVGFKCNPHKIRHTVAKTAAANGAPVADIQAMLHHSSPTMAMRYIGDARRDVEAKLALQWGLAS